MVGRTSSNIALEYLLHRLRYSRWRPLEAILAAIGSQAEEVLEYIDEEIEAGRPKPIDIDTLLTSVVPDLLSLSGT